MKKRIAVLVAFILAAALVSCTYAVPAQETQEVKEDVAEEIAETAGETVEEDAEDTTEETVDETITLSPEQLRDGILAPAIAFHPGTAGTTLGSAQAAAKILAFSTENQLRNADGDQLKQQMADAYALLSDEEKGWLQENLAELLDLTDSVFTDYDGLSGRFEDAGASSTMESVFADEHAQEDWTQVRAALAGLGNDAPAE